MPQTKVWNGSSWAQVKDFSSAKTWNGSSWVNATFKHWDGNGWVTEVGLNRNTTVYGEGTYAPATAQLTLATNGTIPSTGSTWITSTGVNAANYEAYLNPTSGTLTSGTVNTWINISSAPTWTLTVDGQTSYVYANLYIRRVGGGVQTFSRTVTFWAASDYPNIFF